MVDRIEKKKNQRFLICILLFALFYYLRFFEHWMSQYNTTLFALSYKYGFISRGLIGTLWLGLDKLLPVSLMTYKAVYLFSELATWIFVLLLVAVFRQVLEQIDKKQQRNARYIIFFLSTFAFHVFWGDEMFGRLDVYLFILTLLCVLLLLKGKWEWAIVPLCIVAVCIHQGFVFTNFNIVLVLLFYKMMKKNGSKKKYGLIFLVTFVSVSVLFLYFELFSHSNGTEIYGEIVNVSKSLSFDGESYNESIINHEILGKDVYEDELIFHQDNYREFPAALILWSPYILMGLWFLKQLLKNEKKEGLFGYLGVALGGLTIVPEMILKVDYGRYFHLTFYYYILVVLCLMTMGDTKVWDTLDELKEKIRARCLVPWIVLVYPMLLMPFYDILISPAVKKLSIWLFGEVLQ
ncbi:MAG: hypothetical protein K6F30_05005 [Lachnospiraceae bacterium]|nr:hypothetical protein [Lachnospiraceae bacterium]